MFPAKKVGIIGNQGKMARNIYEPLFTGAGCQVIGSDILDPSGMSNDEVVATADVVLFSILPLGNVARAMRAQIPNARPNTLWLHGSSVQQVRDNPIGDVLLIQELRDHGVETGFVHFMIAPTVKSLRGQSIVLGFPRDPINPAWENWLESLLLSKKARVFHKTIEAHDELTKAAQLLPMLLAVAIGMVWRREVVDVSEMLRVAGAPARLQAFGTIRTLGQPEVVSEIITSHPDGPSLVRALANAFTDLAEMVERKDTEAIAAIMQQARELIDGDTLRKTQRLTGWLVQLLGDLNGGAVSLGFTQEQNVLGLLAETLSHFDRHGVNKTTTWARGDPSDGNAQFFIGVEPDLGDSAVEAARREIVDELGAEPVENMFTI